MLSEATSAKLGPIARAIRLNTSSECVGAVSSLPVSSSDLSHHKSHIENRRKSVLSWLDRSLVFAKGSSLLGAIVELGLSFLGHPGPHFSPRFPIVFPRSTPHVHQTLQNRAYPTTFRTQLKQAMVSQSR